MNIPYPVNPITNISSFPARYPGISVLNIACVQKNDLSYDRSYSSPFTGILRNHKMTSLIVPLVVPVSQRSLDSNPVQLGLNFFRL